MDDALGVTPSHTKVQTLGVKLAFPLGRIRRRHCQAGGVGSIRSTSRTNCGGSTSYHCFWKRGRVEEHCSRMIKLTYIRIIIVLASSVNFQPNKSSQHLGLHMNANGCAINSECQKEGLSSVKAETIT